MSIKLRLLLSYIGLLVIPIILLVIVSFFARFYYIGDFQKEYPGVDTIHKAKQVVAERDAIFSTIKQTALISPQSFEDEDFLFYYEDKLNGFNSGLIVRKNNEIIYSPLRMTNIIEENPLPQFGEYVYEQSYPLDTTIKGLQIYQHDFFFDDSSKGSVFMITNVEPMMRSMQNFINMLMISTVVILILTNGTLTYLVAGSIVKPLNKLKTSANRIREGDLDFEININSKDEIGELSNAFEEMRKRLKESLDTQFQYEENRKELFTNISHDLKTPITTIKGYVEGIKDGVADTPHKIEKYINTIYTKTVDVDRLIDDLFLFSKLDLSKLPLHLNRINISKYMVDLLEELNFDLEKKNVMMNYENQVASSTFVLVDVMQLKRVIVNVIENAVKFMDKSEGIINFIVNQKDDYILFEIRDNGQGISKDKLPYIFDRFYRADPSRNSLIGGSGLGLAIAKKIIEEHSGEMWAESIEGLGTSIFFTIKISKSGDTL
ncbi:sensor histidine kinase [Alkaliphilus peptidifermentans]|uniref:histidine kinase n=1 Tax=Alkaliphilus peptidifermentans DSM 18978 TaxID=1120976 RepID=A0A1G5EZP5_9FIRM|nr:HAMP domain-containing sensor histidine kinase [Alkaliphilus peptidifermentans]SCY32374.1 Signal transduction histidine kinase [Alkaliphilus peptidifermentans DSM 18978]